MILSRTTNRTEKNKIGTDMQCGSGFVALLENYSCEVIR